MRLLDTLLNKTVQGATVNPKNEAAKEPAGLFLSSFAKACSSTLKLVFGKTVSKNTQNHEALRASITHVDKADFYNKAPIGAESAYGVMDKYAYEAVDKFHTASFSQGTTQDHINQYRKDLPMGTEDLQKFSERNYHLRDFKDVGQWQRKNGQSRKVVTQALQKELNQKRLLASKGSEYGSCAAFSAMWLSDIEHRKTTPEQPEKRMALLKVGAREAAIRQKIYEDDGYHEDFFHDEYSQRVTEVDANSLKFAGLDVVTEKKAGRLDYDNDNFEQLINSIKPGAGARYEIQFGRANSDGKHEGHATALYRLSDGSFLFFDPNVGEFHVPAAKMRAFMPQFISEYYDNFVSRQTIRIVRPNFTIDSQSSLKISADHQPGLAEVYENKLKLSQQSNQQLARLVQQNKIRSYQNPQANTGQITPSQINPSARKNISSSAALKTQAIYQDRSELMQLNKLSDLYGLPHGLITTTDLSKAIQAKYGVEVLNQLKQDFVLTQDLVLWPETFQLIGKALNQFTPLPNKVTNALPTPKAKPSSPAPTIETPSVINTPFVGFRQEIDAISIGLGLKPGLQTTEELANEIAEKYGSNVLLSAKKELNFLNYKYMLLTGDMRDVRRFLERLAKTIPAKPAATPAPQIKSTTEINEVPLRSQSLKQKIQHCETTLGYVPKTSDFLAYLEKEYGTQAARSAKTKFPSFLTRPDIYLISKQINVVLAFLDN